MSDEGFERNKEKWDGMSGSEQHNIIWASFKDAIDEGHVPENQIKVIWKAKYLMFAIMAAQSFFNGQLPESLTDIYLQAVRAIKDFESMASNASSRGFGTAINLMCESSNDFLKNVKFKNAPTPEQPREIKDD